MRVLLLFLMTLTSSAQAESVRVAVASNFLTTAKDIAAVFEAETGHEVEIVHGSTGKLFAQIRAGAPFDVFLSADQARASRLMDVGDGAAQKAYAIGRLALVHGARTEPGELAEIMVRPGLRFAIADPAVAPYGVAARTVLRDRLGEGWDNNVVLGESVGQAFAFVVTGNADAGLIALAQARTYDGELWVLEVPRHLHDPILQDAILLSRAAEAEAALAFYDFLSKPFAQEILAEAGYEAPV